MSSANINSRMGGGTSYPMMTADDELSIGRGDTAAGSGWLFFAATMLGLAGLMRIVDSIWAFGYHGALPANLNDGVLGSNLHTYAWTWLVVGVVLLVSSFLVIASSQFGRWIGIIAAAVGAISAIVWMPYYPVWSLVYIGIAVLVIYGLVVYGGRRVEA